jgi:hypothetical protein
LLQTISAPNVEIALNNHDIQDAVTATLAAFSSDEELLRVIVNDSSDDDEESLELGMITRHVRHGYDIRYVYVQVPYILNKQQSDTKAS